MRHFLTAFLTIWVSLALFSNGSAQTTRPASRPAVPTQPVIAVAIPKTMDVNVTSYNILGGREKDTVLANIRSSHPDIVYLQEAPRKVVQEYARKLHMKYHFGPYMPAYESGLAILTRGEIEPVKLFTMEGERNFALAAKVTIDGQKLFAVCMHLKSLPRPVSKGVFQVMKPHVRQAKTILAEVRKHDLPSLVGGDCNSLSFSPEYMKFTSELKDCAEGRPAATQPTIYVSDVGYRIDYLFTRGSWFVQEYGVNPNHGSDHHMIHCRLKLKVPGLVTGR